MSERCHEQLDDLLRALLLHQFSRGLVVWAILLVNMASLGMWVPFWASMEVRRRSDVGGVGACHEGVRVM